MLQISIMTQTPLSVSPRWSWSSPLVWNLQLYLTFYQKTGLHNKNDCVLVQSKVSVNKHALFMQIWKNCEQIDVTGPNRRIFGISVGGVSNLQFSSVWNHSKKWAILLCYGNKYLRHTHTPYHMYILQDTVAKLSIMLQVLASAATAYVRFCCVVNNEKKSEKNIFLTVMILGGFSMIINSLLIHETYSFLICR